MLLSAVHHRPSPSPSPPLPQTQGRLLLGTPTPQPLGRMGDAGMLRTPNPCRERRCPDARRKRKLRDGRTACNRVCQIGTAGRLGQAALFRRVEAPSESGTRSGGAGGPAAESHVRTGGVTRCRRPGRAKPAERSERTAQSVAQPSERLQPARCILLLFSPRDHKGLPLSGHRSEHPRAPLPAPRSRPPGSPLPSRIAVNA